MQESRTRALRRRLRTGSYVGQVELMPLDSPRRHSISDQAFARTHGRAAGLDLDKYDGAQVTFAQTVEHQKIDWRTEETGILGIPPEVRQVA